MIYKRRKRTALWVLALGAMSAVLSFVEIKDRASGDFEVRSVARAELRAQVAGFLREAYYDEGDRVSPGMLVVRLEIPNLDSRITQKRAEVQEIEAKLRLLDAGPRPEEVLEQRHRVQRAREWRDLARRELAQARLVLKEELERLDGLIAQCEAELEYAQAALQRAEKLLAKNASTESDYLDAKKKFRVCRSKCRQAQADKRARQAVGTLEAEVELARRENEQAEAFSTLTLLEAGTRPEEIEAAQAHLARLQEELRYSEGLQEKLLIHSPTSGLVVTPRVKEKVGQYFEEGDLICEIAEPAVLEAEILLSEQQVARVRLSQTVQLKARALPFRTFQAKVDRIAPSASIGDVQSSVTVYCRLENSDAALRPGMSGYARNYGERRPIGAIAIDRILGFLRTEFWW